MSREPSTDSLYDELAAYVRARIGEFDEIDDNRKRELEHLARATAGNLAVGKPVKMTFICTHNSRRSHLSQLWAWTAAEVFGVPGVTTYSGGTESTAFNPRAVAAVHRAGFDVEGDREQDNPVYSVRFSDDAEAMECFSKIYDQPPNPTEGFFAVMTCSSANAACPIVHGAAERVAIPYEDPKAFDGTDREAEMYDDRCGEIAREMLFLFSRTEGV